MDDAVLDFCFRINALNRFREAFKAVDAGDQNVFDTAIMQVVQHRQPVVRAFMFGQVQAQ